MATRVAQPLRRRVWIAPLAIALVLVAAGAAAWVTFMRDHGRSELHTGSALRADPATFAEVLKTAKGGETIVLAPGDYGRFAGAVKPSTVTIRAPRGTKARMSLAFTGAANLRLQGLTIDGATITGPTHDVTVAGSTFTKAIVIEAKQMAHANVVLAGNGLPGIDVCHNCYEGRVQVIGDSGRPSGIVLRGNVLGPGGNADGIQNGGNGVQILGNTFVGIHHVEGGPHTDALQLYGQRNTVVRGNTFRDVATGIMAPDGGRHEVIEDNVFDTNGYPYAIMLGGDEGSVIRHNTMPDFGTCIWSSPCGTLLIGPGPGSLPSRGTVVEDNVLGQLSLAGGSVLASDRRNVIAAGGGGPDDLTGKPTFAGGARPGTRSGYRLAAGSPGVKAAADGSDAGIAASTRP